MFGGACAGLAGAYLPLAYTPFFIPGMTAGRGWIALALVVFASWRPGRLVIGAEFRHHATPVHGAGLVGQAERHRVVPARGDGGLVGDRAQIGMGPQRDGPARRRHPEAIVGQRRNRLVGVAHEFRDRPEAAEAPGRA